MEGGEWVPNGAPTQHRYLPVRPLLLVSSLAFVLAAGSAIAQPPATATNAQAPRAAQAQDARFSPAATEAVEVVNRFMAALASNQLDAARQLVAPEAIVIVNGQVFANRDAYIDGPAKGDAAALATVQRELLAREAAAGAEFGIVLSEKRLRPKGATQGPAEIVTETMTLSRTPAGWKINHIHWSNRHAR